MRNFRIIGVVILAAYITMLMPASAQDEAVSLARENKVKVAFLYNFIKFVEWPGTQALSLTHNANICVAGANPFGDALDMLKQASTSQLELTVKLDVSEQDLPRCHILFIGRSQGDNVPSLLSVTKSYPVLTVGEFSGFADSGGIIEMSKAEKSIGLFSKDIINLRVNVKQAEAKKLRIDPQLLEIAAEVIK